MTVPSRYIYECLLHMHQNQQHYETSGMSHDHNTRNRQNIRTEFLRLKTSRNATLHFAPAFFNKLPIRIRELSTVKFKIVLKEYLTQQAFYHYAEFLDRDIDRDLTDF